MKNGHKSKNSLYSPTFERDNCGFGLIANMDDKPSSWVINTSIEALNRLKHRGAVSDDGKSSDGCGLLIKKPDDFFNHCAQELGIKEIPCIIKNCKADTYNIEGTILNTDEEIKKYITPLSFF